MDRRSFLQGSMAATGLGAAAWTLGGWQSRRGLPGDAFCDAEQRGPTSAVVPVVGDGKWVWNEPPSETGYLESRSFQLRIGLTLTGTGAATNLKATTPIPVSYGEQEITEFSIETQNCQASTRLLTPHAAQLCVAAPRIFEGQTIGAIATIRLELRKDYQGFHRDQFPPEQDFPRDFRKLYMYDSPGIQTRQAVVKEMAARISGQFEHPWEKAKAFHTWVHEEIVGRIGPYTSVIEAIRDRVGDCEEKAATFAAFCRVSGIPARIVWAPNHNWAEFYLCDQSGVGHWIPAHTSCYSWFGWTGAHELILQKGDSIPIPEKSKPERLMCDWMQWQGSKPEARYLARLEPRSTEGEADAGPGAREKNEKGQWKPFGPYADKPFMRQ